MNTCDSISIFSKKKLHLSFHNKLKEKMDRRKGMKENCWNFEKDNANLLVVVRFCKWMKVPYIVSSMKGKFTREVGWNFKKFSILAFRVEVLLVTTSYLPIRCACAVPSLCCQSSLCEEMGLSSWIVQKWEWFCNHHILNFSLFTTICHFVSTSPM